MMGPSSTKWWLEEHSPYGLDFDMIGISLYHGWNDGDYAGFGTLGDYVSYIIDTYNIDFLVMETAQLFTSGGNDDWKRKAKNFSRDDWVKSQAALAQSDEQQTAGHY